MKKGLFYITAFLTITVCAFAIWAFKSVPGPPSSYAAVNFMKGTDRYAVFAYAEGSPEEIKYEKGQPDAQVIVQITSKMETKGYELDKYAVDPSGYYFIFKKKP